MAHSAAGVAVKRAPRGRPFQKGEDARRNPGGRKPARATQALHEAITDSDLVAMWKAGMREAKAGDEKWAALIAAYFDGRPVARNENGQPGDFEIDLSTEERERLRSALKVVRGRRDA